MVIVLTENNGFKKIDWTMIQVTETYPTFRFLTRIIVNKDVYYSTQSLESVMNEICQTSGSTYVGRVKAARKLLNMSRLPPILIGYQMKAIVAIPFPKVGGGYAYLFCPSFIAEPTQDGTMLISITENIELKVSLGERAFKNRIQKADALIRLMKL